ncbi:cofactor-independent phosphoglycerate mutase, partial [Dehalococcoidia bacterium]|nr:cofactor-independent phosphoglycerate mutase [Dehalococcoidia bacterium]
RLRSWQDDELRVLVLPDHATPIKVMTHTPDPVPFVFWGPGFESNGARSFSESSAAETGLFIERGHELAEKLIFSFHHELR